MKKIVHQLKFILILLAFAFVAFNCGGNKENEGSTKSDTESSVKVQGNGQTIAYVNIDTLLAQYEFSKKSEKEISSKQSAAENDLQTRGKQLEGEVLNYQQTVNNMTIQNAKNTEAALQQKQQDLMNYRDMVGRELMQEQAKTTEKLYENITEFLKRYAKKNGFSYILTFSKANPTILYADSTLDVTKDVVKGLNAEYTEKATK